MIHDKLMLIYFQTASALMYDAVKVFASALRDFSLNVEIEVPVLDCSNPSKWPQGELILKLLDEVIQFTSNFYSTISS